MTRLKRMLVNSMLTSSADTSHHQLKQKQKEKIKMSTPLTPKRTQFFFDLSGVKCKALGDINRLRQSWDTFERVENYDDIIYQKLSVGIRDSMFYQYKNREELNYYRIGQNLHEQRYPGVDFTSIRNLPFPDVSSITGIPTVNGPPKICGPFQNTIANSERMNKMTDLNTYIYISSYNSQHAYKYNFKSDDEKLAYNRAERALQSPQT